MSIVPIEYTSTLSSSNTLFCNDVDTFLDNSIINVSTIVINEGCVNVYFPVMYFNGLIYINSNSTTNVNIYLPVIDIPSTPPYKYDTSIILESNKYIYIQYSFNKLPIIPISPTNPSSNIFPYNTNPQLMMFEISINGVTAEILDPVISSIINLPNASTSPTQGYLNVSFLPPIVISPRAGATHRMLYYNFDICTNRLPSNTTDPVLAYYRVLGSGISKSGSIAGDLSLYFPQIVYENPGIPPEETLPLSFKVNGYSSSELSLIFPIRCFLAIQPL